MIQCPHHPGAFAQVVLCEGDKSPSFSLATRGGLAQPDNHSQASFFSLGFSPPLLVSLRRRLRLEPARFEPAEPMAGRWEGREMGRYEGRRRTALYRRWRTLTAFARELNQSIDAALADGATDLADCTMAERAQVVTAAVDLCHLIWPHSSGQMAAHTFRRVRPCHLARAEVSVMDLLLLTWLLGAALCLALAYVSR